jgi:hypothetical protein
MAPSAFDAYVRACFYAGANPEFLADGKTRRVGQRIGNAGPSAGYHAKDGDVTVNGKQIPYCAAVDLRTNGMTAAQIKKLLQELARQGFAAWYRFEGKFTNNRHIHAVFAGLPMKQQLRSQVIDFLNDRTGLVGHAEETFYTAPTALDKPLALMLVRSNPTTKKKVPSNLLA